MASSVIPTLGVPVPVTSPSPPVYATLEYVDERFGAVEPAPVGPLIQSGKIDLTSNGQIVVLPTPYTTSMQVFVQGTSNKAGVNGFFTIATYGSKTEFRVFYSGELIYGAIEVFWFAVGS